MAPRTKAERATRPPREQHVFVPPSLNQPLDDAYTAFKTAVLPRFPVQELNEQDISNASEALAIWEKSEEISGKYVTESSKNLVDEMLLATEYLLTHPGVPGLDISLLQERCKALRKKIYLVLLNEELNSNGNLDLLAKASEWTADIESHVLSPRSHALSWYFEKFRKILGFLDASSQLQKNSQVISALQRLFEVAYIPHFDHLKVVHEILIQPGSLDDNVKTIYATRLSGAVDPRTLPEFSRANIQQKIEAMNIACPTRDFSAVRALADYFEALPKTSDAIVFGCIRLTLEQSASNIEKSTDSDQQDLACRLYSIAKRMQDPSSNLGMVSRPSSYSLDSKERLQVTFRDTSLVKDAPFSKHTDRRKYDDLILDASPLEPTQDLLVRFVGEVNRRHRHPFFPISNFELIVTNKSTTGSSATELHIGPQWFTQGTVADVLLGSTSISYTRRDGAQDLQQQPPPFRLLWPFQRQYPVSAPQPPPHWIRSPNVPGPWQEISSLQFIGDGVELTAHSTYPPLIARTLLLPKTSSYSMITTSSIQLRRLRISPTLLEARLAFPLTPDQARSLLGRTVFYQSADPEVQTRERRLPHNKRRKVEPELDPVYLAYVWGLDLDAKIIKTVEFANEDSGELCRTFKFDDAETPLPTFLQPTSLPEDYPALRKVATFDWIGLVKLPMPIPPSEDAEATKKEIVRMRKRFSEILAAAPLLFEIGIEDDRALVIGDLMIHPPGSSGTVTVENCKVGIWESGYRKMEGPNDMEFLIWIQWIRSGTIDLTAPASAFSRPQTEAPTPLPSDLAWEDQGWVSTDAGVAAIVSRGILRPSSMVALTGKSDYEGFLERLVLSGSEDGRYHIPGGISSYTGGDGSFLVQVSKDAQGNIIAVRVTGNGGGDDI